MSRKRTNPPEQPPDPWPHRLAWVLVCAVFPLIWMGSLVTTYRAGMAVPDWPTTFGHWFYPLQDWLWKWGEDVFLEHGHRTVAQLTGLTAIALAVVIWKRDRRKWMRWMAAAAVGGVIFQGTLGGFRVLWDELLLAKIHGCTAPLYFGLCAAMVVLTSPRWQGPDQPKPHPAAPGLHRLALATTLALYVPIVLGVQLRHLPPDSGMGWFELWVWLKLIAAGLAAVAVVWLLVHVVRHFRGEATIVRRTRILVVLLSAQLVLGAGAWVTHYGWPQWFTNNFWAIKYTITQEGPLQVWITTAHAALGSLNLVVALSLVLWSRRLVQSETS